MYHRTIFALSALVAALAFAGCAKRATTTTATNGYKPMNSASRIVPVGDLALIDLGEDGEVAVMLVENGKIVMDFPAGEELSPGSQHLLSSDGAYAAVLYGVRVRTTPYTVVDSFAIVDGRKGTVTRFGGSWAAADTVWRTLTGKVLPLPTSYRGTGGMPPLPPPSTPPKRFDEWGHVP